MFRFISSCHKTHFSPKDSTDVVDTANGYLLKQANDIIYQDLKEFINVLKKQALRFKSTPCIGRTHGIAIVESVAK